jgi:hypothetical protein
VSKLQRAASVATRCGWSATQPRSFGSGSADQEPY